MILHVIHRVNELHRYNLESRAFRTISAFKSPLVQELPADSPTMLIYYHFSHYSILLNILNHLK